MTLSTTHAFTIEVQCAPPIEVGATPLGYRRVIPIIGGTFAGPALSGTVLPGGADWNVRRADGSFHVWARYELRTDEGAVVSIINEGFFQPSPDADPSNPASLASLTRPTFEVGEGGPTWLNSATFIGILRPNPASGVVSVEVHRVELER